MTDNAELLPLPWRPIAEAPATPTRMVLCWDDCVGLPAHWELGWRRSDGQWVNTYGKPFGGEPTHFFIPNTTRVPVPDTSLGSPMDPIGWRLVPVEPTPEMIAAAKRGAVIERRLEAIWLRGLRANWATMLSAAPVPASPPVVGKEPICLPPDDTDVKLVLHATLPTCPCCSGTPTTFARYFEHSAIYQSYVHCSHCDVQVFVNSRDREEARKHAIARWSKRPAALSKPRVSREEQQAAFLVALAEAGIPPDVQELLVQGNPSIGVPPGALGKAIALIGGGA